MTTIIATLQQDPRPAYLLTPYTRYARGWTGAYIDACRLAARIHRKYKLVCFSPISHCHGMTTHGDLPPVDGAFWKRFNQPFVDICCAGIVAKMDGWDNSDGIKDEIADFRAAKKTVLFIEPETLELSLA